MTRIDNQPMGSSLGRYVIYIYIYIGLKLSEKRPFIPQYYVLVLFPGSELCELHPPSSKYSGITIVIRALRGKFMSQHDHLPQK